MTGFEIALLDFDGTMAATRPGVAACLRRTLTELHRTEPDEAALSAVIARGLDLGDTFRRLAPRLSESEIEACVIRYRVHYPTVGIAGTLLYDGVASTLRKLRDMGVSLVVLSNKGRVAVDATLARFGLTDSIDHVLAEEGGAPVKPHPDLFHRRIAALFGARSASDYLLVGDTEADLRFARAVGIAACWAGYGYGDPLACRALAPGHEIAAFPELIEIVMRSQVPRASASAATAMSISGSS
jgi:phosphoglycolate phosphatase